MLDRQVIELNDAMVALVAPLGGVGQHVCVAIARLQPTADVSSTPQVRNMIHSRGIGGSGCS